MAFDHKKIEQEVIDFWNQTKIYEAIKKRNSAGKKFYFLQGPPYTSGRLHSGHAWNHALKDMVLRYKRMNNFNVWDRGGFDMHGLPTEHKVMEKNNLKFKQDIISFGIEKFNTECLEWSKEKATLMNEDLKRLGVWLDHDNAYMPITQEFIEGEWWLVKQAWKKDRLYKGKKTMQWCANCETALAKHECEYKNVTDNSVFVKFKVKGKDEYLIIWTTTPWTLAFNLAVMVNPDLDYVRARVDSETWIVAEELAAPVIQAVAEKQFNVLEKIKGRKLEGLEYEHPWINEIPVLKEVKEKYPKTHTIILSSEYVTLDAGSGLVHCAPGCGPEDYEVGHKYGLPAFNTIDEKGVFSDEMGKFAGKRAKKDDAFFVEQLGNNLINGAPVDHDYAHCQRCKNPVVFRATEQWFFKVEDLKEKMIEANEKVLWVPDTGKNAFRSWLENLRDNSITKQRFWGTPVPIWECKCGNYFVVESVAELKQLGAQKVPSNLHIPWIDEVTIPCGKCAKDMKRIPDVLDVWIDAGTTSWNCLNFPRNQELIKKLWPVDLILEGKDQIRGWFNLLMVASFLGFDKPCFNSVFMHGFLTDVEGVKMSKSLGNIISPYEIVEKYGADTLRYYFSSTKAGEDINFSWDEAALRYRNLVVLFNVHNYLIELAKESGTNPAKIMVNANNLSFEEKYIISRLHSTIRKVTELFEAYRLDETISKMDELFLDLSRIYIKMIRDKATFGEDSEKSIIVWTIYNVLLENLKMFSTVAPFTCEKIYQNLKQEFGLQEESIHGFRWPKYDDKLILRELEIEMNMANSVIQGILGAREKAGLGLRWPVKHVAVVTSDIDTRKAVEALHEIIKSQTNVKELCVMENYPDAKTKVRADYAKLEPVFGEIDSAKIIARLATESNETILRHLNEEKSYRINIDDKKFDILPEHVIIETIAPSNIVVGVFKKGNIYLNISRTIELDAEGFARETMRRVQQLRKNKGMQKKDRISLYVEVDDNMVAHLLKFNDQIKEKCGVATLEISDKSPLEEYFASSAEKIKGKKCNIFFDKCKI
ncbi:MAG: isoleucine--tRNA ligase [Candidatus Woesearchaeota archaeon]